MADKKKHAVNLLLLKPLHNRRWEELDGGNVAVLQPRFSNRFVKRLIDPLLRHPDIRISLDRHGSFVWKRCNGRLTVGEIARDYEEAFGPGEEPVVDRVALFMKHLERYEFITYPNLKELMAQSSSVARKEVSQ
ncbi:MAG: PqqD family protein [Candidatus Eremiobacteraeota bacterium]|nr:PqqD family protein [Candidatus Eremiobacteraeota bacterium]